MVIARRDEAAGKCVIPSRNAEKELAVGAPGAKGLSNPVHLERRRDLIHPIQTQSIQSRLHTVHFNKITAPHACSFQCFSFGFGFGPWRFLILVPSFDTW